MTLTISTSTQTDGSMKPLNKDDIERTSRARIDFLRRSNIQAEDTTVVRIEYGSDNYCRYQSLDESYKGDGITRPSTLIVDALVVTKPHHALFLPLADCIGAVIHDPHTNTLMVSHLGRHNLEQFGGSASIKYLIREHNVNPKDVTVWLSPAAGNKSYPLFAFDNRSLHDVATEQLIKAGILQEAITTSSIDTTTNENYYSHSEFLKGYRSNNGRFAIVAVMN